MGGVRGLLAVAALTAVAAVPPVPAGASGGKSGTQEHRTAPKLAQVGHVVFWECPAKTTELLVAVNTLTLHPGATLDISFTVRNGATTACNYTAPYAGVAPGPTATTLEAGPCGSVGFEVEGSHHGNVWPGAQLVNCPALGFALLAPNGTVSGTGRWDQTKPNSTQRVPVGNYTLVVNNNRHFSFPLHVVGS
ncbi:MAG: hypothetical protein ABSE98_08320 [Acidimicrobiales bacterium]